LGPGKTGTSAIQTFFCNNDQILSDKGVHYLRNLRFGGGHHPLAWILHHKHSCENLMDSYSALYIAQPDKYLKDLVEEVEKIDGKAILISSEIFPFLSSEAIDELRSLFKGMPIKVIFYVRNIREQSLSLAAEVVKFQSSSINDERISNIYDNHIKLSYRNNMRCLNLWQDKIGKSNIIFRKYGYDYFKGGNIFADILDVLDLPITDDYIISKNLHNESLTCCETIYFKDMLNRLTLKTQQHLLIENLIKWEKNNQGTKFFLPIDTSLKIDDDAASIHKYLLDNYLDNDFEEVFNKKELVNQKPEYKLAYSDFMNLLDFMDNQINGFKEDVIQSLMIALDRTYEYEIKAREFENNLTKIIKDNNPVAVWGCGDIADKLFRKYNFGGDVLFFVVDKQTKKQGTIFWGHEVLPPAAIAEKGIDTVIITSVAFADDICKEIKDKYKGVKKIIKVTGVHIQLGIEIMDVY
jgi:hypothetical protein